MIGKKIQNYKILSLLGEGGMGVVYKALDIKLERYAALKILNINSTRFDSLIVRFRREARNQARLSHPNIVSVYGFVEERNIMGIAMEYVEGQTIEQIIRHEGRLEPYHALDILSQILNGISYAHSQGFIHRDLKPSNIIIDLNGNTKIMDFGISKSVDEMESITQHNVRPGTLLYMSPEQLSGNEVTVRSDLYSIGIILYEMLTGNYPYNSNTFYDIVDSHINKIPLKISDTLTEVPPQADDIILRGMGKALSDNFRNADEFKYEVDSLLRKIETVPEFIGDNSFGENEEEFKSSENRTGTIIGNFFLFLVFAALAVAVYFFADQYIEEQKVLKKNNPLNYSQDYTGNPNYMEITKWEEFSIRRDVNLNAFCQIDNLNGFIAGDKGLLIKTTDAGQNWVDIKSDVREDLHSIIYHNGKKYAAGDRGLLLTSEFNSGKWIKIPTGTSETLFSIEFINDNTGFITGSNGLILRSSDGGFTWEEKKSGVRESLFNIGFADEKTGYAVGWNGTMLKTLDQGLTWKRIRSGYSAYYKDILFVNQFLGFIVGGEGTVLRTENGGGSWARVNIGSASGLYRIFFDNNEEGMILSNRGEIFNTFDAGKSWTRNTVGKTVILNDIQKLSTGRYIIVGNAGSVFRSKLKVEQLN